MKLLLPLCLVTASLGASPSHAEPVSVRQPQGASHGFLVIRSATGSLIGSGEYLQTVRRDPAPHHGLDLLTSRLILRFKDGSLDDETCTYTQQTVFAFLSDHHIQRGPFFSHPIDYLVEANGQVTSRDGQGKDAKVETTHIDLPNDLSNGLVSVMLLNISPNTPETRIAMIAASGKGRMIKLVINPDGEQSFTAVTGVRRKASVFRIHPELGGVAGVVAPIIGKQPGDVYIEVMEGPAPLIVREFGPLAEGGPAVSIELAGTSFPPGSAH